MLQSFWILASTFLTVLTYVFVKLVKDDCWFGEILLVRSIFLVGIILVLARWQGVRPVTRFPFWHLLRCLAGVAALALNIITAQELPIAAAQTLAYTAPLFVAGFAVIRSTARGRPAGWPLAATVAAGFIGICLVLKPSFSTSGALYPVLGLASAVCAAVTSLTLRHLGAQGEPVLRTALFFAIGCLIASAVLCLARPSHSLTELFSMPELLMVGVLTVGAQLAQTQGWGHGKTLLCANLQFSAIVFSTLLGWLFFGEQFGADTYAGIALVIVTEVLATTLQARESARRAAG